MLARARTLSGPWLLAWLLLLPLGPRAADRIHLVLLHTNDLHGQVEPRRGEGGLARLGAAIERERRAALRQGAQVLVLDAGDWWQGTPEGALDGGAAYLRALAAIGYDALCLGNHDLDRGLEHLSELLGATRLPALAANVHPRAGSRASPRGACASLLWKSGGLAVRLVGLLTPATRTLAPRARALDFEQPAECLERLRADAQEPADLWIALTHLGLEDDRRLARAVPWLDLIVGGHSHSFLEHGEGVGRCLVVQAGARAAVLGRVDLWLDARSHAVLERRARLIELEREPTATERIPALERAVAHMGARVEERMSAVLGALPRPLERDPRPLHSSSLGNWVCDCLREAAEADLALHNKSGLRSDLPAGSVRRRELHELVPFGDRLVRLELSGRELEALLRRAVRGELSVELELSGVEVRYDCRDPEAGPLAIRVGGEPLEAERRYRLAAPSYLAGREGRLRELAHGGGLVADGAELVDVLEGCLHGQRVQLLDEARWSCLR